MRPVLTDFQVLSVFFDFCPNPWIILIGSKIKESVISNSCHKIWNIFTDWSNRIKYLRWKFKQKGYVRSNSCLCFILCNERDFLLDNRRSLQNRGSMMTTSKIFVYSRNGNASSLSLSFLYIPALNHTCKLSKLRHSSFVHWFVVRMSISKDFVKWLSEYDFFVVVLSYSGALWLGNPHEVYFCTFFATRFLTPVMLPVRYYFSSKVEN